MPRTATGTRGRTRTMLRVGAPFFVIVVFIVASNGAEDSGVDAARARWQEHGPEAYELTYTLRGFGPATVVWDGQAVVEYRTDDPHLEDAPVHWVDSLLDAVAEVESDPRGDVLAVEFDPTNGMPLSARLDPDNDRRDDEWEFAVLALTALDRD